MTISMRSLCDNLKFVITFCLFTYISATFSQKNLFLEINSSNGFGNDYIYDAVQDSLGHMWFATGSGLIKLNDRDSEIIPINDKATEQLLYCIGIGANSLWLGGKSGYVARHTTLETTKITTPFKQRIVSIQTINNEKTLFASENEGIYIYELQKDTGTYITKDQLDIGKIINIKKYKDKWYFCTSKELAIFEFKDNNFSLIRKIKKLKKTNDLYFLNDNTLLVGSERKGLLLAKLNNLEIDTVSSELNDVLGINSNVKQVFKDEDNSFWISTFGQGVFEVKFNNNFDVTKVSVYNSKTGLNTDFVNKTFQDYEGNIWINTYGNGVLYKARDYVRLIPFNFDEVNITSVISYEDGVIFSSKNSIYFTQNEQLLDTIYISPNQTHQIQTLEPVNNDSILYSINGEGLFILNRRSKKSEKIQFTKEILSRDIKDILIARDKSVWLATYNGVYHITLKGEIIKHFTTQNGLRHNLCYSLSEDHEGNILVGSKSNRLSIITSNETKELKIPGINPSMIINQISVMPDSSIWLGTLGSGLFHVRKDSIINFHKYNGLQDNFVFNISPLQKDHILIVHERGIGKINTQDYSIENFSSKYGIASKYVENSSCNSHNGNIYWGATGGIVAFNPIKYFGKNIVPKVGFSNLYINDTIVKSLHNQIIELPYDKYKIILDYKGVSFSNSENIKYSYFLEGYDDEWHDGQQLEMAVYKNIGPGKYKFKIKACLNETCVEKMADFVIIIDKPVWKKAWFIILISFILGTIILGSFYLQAMSNARKKRILEYNIEMKTKELKLKNEHIISSITYAKRIQDAVMPDKSILKNDIFDSLTVEIPKDIVGGDFIWQEKQDDKLFVALCDCTGHGVPGGFMTILSANLLSNVIIEKGISDPAEILSILNQRVLKQLHQSSETEVKDGMDMSLIVIDFKEKTLSYSGANRPFFIKEISKPLEYLKGTRQSIGDDFRQLDYQVLTFNLNKIEAFYLFSDGFVDQFGGPKKSKYSRKQLMQKIESLSGSSAQHQEEDLTKSIISWKENYEFQLDDITLLGFVRK